MTLVRLVTVALMLALAGGAAACADGDGDEEAGPTTRATRAEREVPPAGEPAQAVFDFVRAVEANDWRVSWQLLSNRTKLTFQIDQRHWADTLVPALRRDLRRGGSVVFERRFGDDRALVVLRGAAANAPFAASLVGEQGGWRLQLFYPEFNPIRPTPGERVSAGRQRLMLDIVRRRDRALNLRLWLDGEPLRPTLETKGNFNNSYQARANVGRGRHLVVAYATTSEGLSGAAAWEFSAR